MDLQSFVRDVPRQKFQQIFQKGVKVIYEDALARLSSNTQLLDALLSLDSVPDELTLSFLDSLSTAPSEPEPAPRDALSFRVVKHYADWAPVTPKSFLQLFSSRYRELSRILYRKPQLKSTVSISQLSRVKGREDLSIIGLVREISELNDGRRILVVEDLSGSTKVILPASLPGKEDVVLDEVIGVTGQAGRGIFFANQLIFPDIAPVEWPRAPRPKALFISDIHVGSKKYLEDTWEKFVSWLNEHREVKYLFIAGDLVDGVGMYQGQANSLEIDTFEGQIEALARYLKQTRHDLRIISISGNHDPNRDSEPQPTFPEEILKPLRHVKNLEVYSNPSWLEIEGLTFLLYHGTSFDGLIDAVGSIRARGYHEPHLAQMQLLKKRHLSPIFGRNKLFPDSQDFMVIDRVPHVFHTGHVHKVDVSTYKGVRLVSSGTFQDVTDFQEKLGHEPSPGKFVLMDLSDGSSSVLDFSKVR